MSTVSHINIKEVHDIIDLAVQHRAGVFTFARYVPISVKKNISLRSTNTKIAEGASWLSDAGDVMQSQEDSLVISLPVIPSAGTL